METAGRTWLTTGQAAQMCAVTPATILNWIRAGRLEGIRTPGGHYRVRPEKLRPLLGYRKNPTLKLDPSGADAPLRCWEYLSEAGKIREECRTCVVHRVRASWCFQIATLGIESGHARRFCPTNCDDCAYYRRVNGLPTNVLIVSSDPDLLQQLAGQKDPAIILRVAHNAYEASAVVEDFLPAFAVVDLETSAAPENGLLESLARDPRLPGLKTVIAVGSGRSQRKRILKGDPPIAGRIEKPFDLAHLQAVIESFPVEYV